MKLLKSFGLSSDLALRTLLILTTTLVLTFVAKNVNYDLYLSLRKAQPVAPSVKILEIKNLYELEDILLKADLSSIRDIFIYENTIVTPALNKKVRFYDPALREDSASAKDETSLGLAADSDGLLRRYSGSVPSDFSQRSEKNRPTTGAIERRLINFRGKEGTVPRLYREDLLSTNTLRQETSLSLVVLNRLNPRPIVTPLGPMPESEVVSNILDNALEGRFIQKASTPTQLAICALLLVLCYFSIFQLPAFLSLIGMGLLFLFYVSVSLFLFDQFSLWLPFLTPFAQLILTYVLISNYKYMLEENSKWRLKRQARDRREVEEMKNNFLSLFSHDLKTPLAKILGISEQLLSDTALAEKHIEEIKKVKTYSRQLETYLKRILKISQLESDSLSLTKTQNDINQTIERSLRKTALLAKDKQITVTLKSEPLFQIAFDPFLIEEVLFNFIENAIQYSPPGSQISVESQEVGDSVKVAVKDTGPGVPQHLQQKIWEKFFRLETKKQGYGLGLYLSKYVIELHGGQVYLKSQPEQGSEFGFSLPIDGDNAP